MVEMAHKTKDTQKRQQNRTSMPSHSENSPSIYGEYQMGIFVCTLRKSNERTGILSKFAEASLPTVREESRWLPDFATFKILR